MISGFTFCSLLGKIPVDAGVEGKERRHVERNCKREHSYSTLALLCCLIPVLGEFVMRSMICSLLGLGGSALEPR